MIKKILKNFTLVASGNIIVSIFSIFILFFNVNNLGKDFFGLLAIFTTSIIIVDRLFTVDMWQQIIKFGNTYYLKKNYNKFRDIYTFCFVNEFILSILSFVTANIFLYIAFKIINFSIEYLTLGQIFSLSLIFRCSNSSIGILRIFNKFNLITINQIFFSFITLLITFYFWLFNFKFEYYIYLYLIIFSFEHIFYNLISFTLWIKKRKPSLFKINLNDKKLFLSVYKFSFSGWMVSTLSTIKNFDIHIIGFFFDIGSAGVYKFAASLASFSVKLSIPLQQVIFPEISYLFVKKQLNKLKKVLYHVISYGIIYVLISTIFIVNFGDEITFLIGGEEFKNAISLLIILTLSSSIRAAGFFIRPTFLIGISHKAYLKNFIFSFLFFICFIIIGIFDENLILVCIAHLVFDVTHYIYGIVILKIYSFINFKKTNIFFR